MLERSSTDQRSQRVPPDTQTGGPRPPGELEPESFLRLGRYAGLQMIGRGGMGVVYAAQDEQLGRKVAIKILARRAQQPDAHARLLREAQALARLAHPNVVAVHEVGEAEGRVYLVMEHVDGLTLRAWLNRHRRSQAELLAVLTQAGRGLAAAHAVGLIHRDFKPENVMVGDDGRVRVMDFGLARATDSSLDEPAAALSSSMRWLDVNVTRTGSLLGTPGYMAPEQHLHCPPSASSDIFGFCVVLFEALHGQRPFAGPDPQAIRDAILARAIQRPVRTEVPRWLDELILRGLAADPGQRWPSMPALLSALAHDPLLRRRKLLRAALLLGLLAVLALPLVLLGFDGLRAAVRAEADDTATARLALVETSVRRADTPDQHDAADAVFRAFVDDPAHQGTRALALAWQHRGDHLRAASDDDGALAAYAQAYVQANFPADTDLALRSLAGAFRRKGDGHALTRTLAALQARGAADPELLGLAFDAAILQRDLPRAAEAAARLDVDDPRSRWRPLLGALASGTGSSIRAFDLTVLPGAPPSFAALDTQALTFVDHDLRPIERRNLTGTLRVAAGAPWLFQQQDDTLAVFDLRAPAGALPVWRGPSGAGPYRVFPLRAGSSDPDILFARMAPHRGFRLLHGLGGPDPQERVAHAATDEADSDLEAALEDDLDRDGTPELVAAIGPWHAFDLRVFHRDPAGELALVHRRRLGRVGALGVLRRGDERLLVAVKDDHVVDPDIFPDAPHTGVAAGIYLFRWTGAELVEVGFTPLPAEITERHAPVGRLIAADLDGDGDDELLVPVNLDGWSTLVARSAPTGLDLLLLDGLRVLAAAQLDPDPAVELLATLRPGNVLWQLGRGHTPLPARLSPQDTPRPIPTDLRDPLLREQWSRTEELAAAGLFAAAASGLERAANFISHEHLRRAAWSRAAELYTAQRDFTAALALDRRLADDPTLGAAALARSAAALTHFGRYEEARAAALALSDHPARDPAQTLAARELLADLDPLLDDRRRFDLRFDRPLADAWHIVRPVALRREPTRGVLAIAAAPAPEPLAELPFAWEGGPLFVEYDLDIERLEYGACLHLQIVDDHDHVRLSTGYCAQGGGGVLYHRGECGQGPGQSANNLPLVPVASGLTPHRARLAAAYFPRRNAFECTLEEAGRSELRQIHPTESPSPGRYRLQLVVTGLDRPPTLALGALRQIRVRGAQLLPAAPRDRPGRLLVEGEPRPALSELALFDPDLARPALIRLLAYDDLGDGAGLAAAAQDVLPHLNDPTWRADLVTILRTRPAAATALRGAAGPALLPLLADAWSFLPQHRNDEALRREALDDLQVLDVLAPRTDPERLALRALLCARADLRARVGLPDRARRDFEAALAIPATSTRPDADLRLRAHLALAAMLAPGEPTLAFQHATHALKLGRVPEQVREQLREVPDIARLMALTPAWRALLGAP